MPLVLTLSLNPTIDVSSEAETVRPTHKTRTEHEVFEPGGGGINVARVVCELGGDTLAVCLAGGASGSLLDDLLAQIGLPRKIIPISGNTRIALMVYERSTGQEYRFIPSGPHLQPDEIAACLAAIEAAEFDCLVASGSVPAGCEPDILARVGAIAARHEVPFILDSSGPGLGETLGRTPVKLVKPSLNEFQAYVGRTLGSPDEVARAARAVVGDGHAEIIAVTLGMDGAVIASADGAFLVRAPKVKTRSAVGAGDSFVGGVTLALLEGRDLEEAALLGTAAGAAAALNPGTGVCQRPDILRIYEELSADPHAVERLAA